MVETVLFPRELDSKEGDDIKIGYNDTALDYITQFNLDKYPHISNFLYKRINKFFELLEWANLKKDELEFLYCLTEFMPDIKYESYRRLLYGILDKMKDKNYNPKYLKLSTTTTREKNIVKSFKNFEKMKILIKIKCDKKRKGFKDFFQFNIEGLEKKFHLNIFEIKYILYSILYDRDKSDILYFYPLKHINLDELNKLVIKLNRIEKDKKRIYESLRKRDSKKRKEIGEIAWMITKREILTSDEEEKILLLLEKKLKESMELDFYKGPLRI